MISFYWFIDFNRKGLTLLELLITIAIILIITGIISSRLDFGLKNQRLEADSKELASNITLAQQYAIGQRDTNRYYGVVFYNGGYRIVPYSDPDTPLNPPKPLNPIWVPSSENINGDIPLSEGINISGEQNIIFDSRGSTLLPNDIQIVLSCDSSTRKITVTRLTGHVALD